MMPVKESNPLCAFEKSGCGQSTSCLADYQSCDQWASGSGIFFYQTFESHRQLVDRIWWRELKGLCECLIGNGLRVLCNLTKMLPNTLL